MKKDRYIIIIFIFFTLSIAGCRSFKHTTATNDLKTVVPKASADAIIVSPVTMPVLFVVFVVKSPFTIPIEYSAYAIYDEDSVIGNGILLEGRE